MAWSIAQVARMSGVSSRTLRHYDDIGLVRPDHVGGNGYRYYEREQLLRLQQVMVLRELGMGLAAIGKILGGETDPVEALRRHRGWLVEERDRMDRLVRTVDKTLAELSERAEGREGREGKEGREGREGDGLMRPEELFEGFDPDRQARYEAELVDRYGEGVREQIAESRRRVGSWTKEDAEGVSAGYADVEERLTGLLLAGAATDDPRVLDVLDEHYAIVAKFWPPNAEQYAGLGDLYVDSPDFKVRYDARHPGLAEFMRDAMAAYALTRMS